MTRLPNEITYQGKPLALFTGDQRIQQITIKKLEEINPFLHSDIKYSYRGQADKSWPLKTTLERLLVNKNPSISSSVMERKILDNYKSCFSIFASELGYDPRSQTNIDALSDIQHYGGPTRLLDWTESFVTAMYFATFRNYTTDAAIYCLRTIVFNCSTFDPHDFLRNQPCAPGAMDTLPPPLDKNRLLFYHTPARKNPRIQNQQGHFIYPGSPDQSFEEALSYSLDSIPITYQESDCCSDEERKDIIKKSTLIKVIIPAGILQDMHLYLRNNNISSKSLYPDYYGAIQSLYEINLNSING